MADKKTLCDMDRVTPALQCGGCSKRNEFFFHAKYLKIMLTFGQT